MITVAIEVERMKRRRYSGKLERVEFLFPETWEEMTWKQLKAVAVLLERQKNSPLDVNPQLILSLLPVRNRVKRALDLENYAALYELLEFMSKPLAWKRTKQRKSWPMRAPSSLLANFTLDQLILCDRYAGAYARTGGRKELRALASAIYTWGSQDFCGRSLKNTRRGVLFCSTRHLLAVRLNYTALRNALGDQFREAFSGGGKGGGKGDPWLSLRVALAGDKFGNPEEVGATKVHSILIHLRDEALAVKRSKQKNRT
jgi:hypothetical protein